MVDDSKIPGKLVVVEGLDGSGKSTQIYLVKRWLEFLNIKVFFTEWNSSVLVKGATKKGKKLKLLTPTTFSLIHCTDFADRYERQVLPLLRSGFVVLADRYMYTAFARDVVRGCDREWVRKLYGFAIKPDIAFFFNLPLEIALGRILDGRPTLKYHEAGMDMGLSQDPYESFRLFQKKILQEYKRMLGEFDFVTVDATESVEKQQMTVRQVIEKRIDLPKFKMRRRR